MIMKIIKKVRTIILTKDTDIMMRKYITDLSYQRGLLQFFIDTVVDIVDYKNIDITKIKHSKQNGDYKITSAAFEQENYKTMLNFCKKNKISFNVLIETMMLKYMQANG